MGLRAVSRMSSMRPRTLNLASKEETWNFTVRSERFSSEADFLVCETAENAVEDFLFAASEPNSALDLVPCLEKLFSFFLQATQAFLRCGNHNHVITGGLAAHQTVHGEKAGGVINWELPPSGRLLHENERSRRSFLVEEIDNRRERFRVG